MISNLKVDTLTPVYLHAISNGNALEGSFNCGFKIKIYDDSKINQSFDMVSLLSDVPLYETIDMCLKLLFTDSNTNVVVITL